MTEKTNLRVELALKNKELLKKADELTKANTELALQHHEREQWAADLLRANKELTFQNEEKEKHAAQLLVANAELLIQNLEKEKIASELIIANNELAYQNTEKENRAAELIEINKNLAFQIDENKQRTQELLHANKELESFTFISSHDLQEPLRKIQTFASRILSDEYHGLSAGSQKYFGRIQFAASHMQHLINDLLAYSRTTEKKSNSAVASLSKIVDVVKLVFEDEIKNYGIEVSVKGIDQIFIIHFQFRQLLINLMRNSIKYAKPGEKLQIHINCAKIPASHSIDFLKNGVEYHHIVFCDNGIGFDPRYNERVFDIFEQLDNLPHSSGTGMGLTIVKKIVENHGGIITASGKPGIGARFNIYLPSAEKN